MSRNPTSGTTRIPTDITTILMEGGVGRPASVARHIVRHTAGGTRLLGVGIDPTEAICFDPVHYCVYRIPASPLGTHPTETTIDWRSVADPRSWLDANGDDLAWTHPRYRGIESDASDHWPYRLETCPITPNI